MLISDNCWEKHRSKYKEFSEGTSKSDLLQQIKVIDADLLLLSTNTALYFEIPVTMVKSQELIYLCAVSLALVTLSRCGSFVTVTEDEAVQLEFPYSCDSNTVTILIANRLPFYNSEEPEYLNLPFYKLNRFSVTNENCLVQVEINPVKRIDEATYICKAYKDGVIHDKFTKIMLNVNYPPGNVACTFSISDDSVGDWVPLQCTANVGSLAGGIYCYQDSKRLPPQSRLVKIGETLKQVIWVGREYPIFCCSSILDRPKDMCACKDFVWDPMGDISQTNTTIDACPSTTPGPVTTLPQHIEREVEDNPQLTQPLAILKLNKENKDMSTHNNIAVVWGCVIVIGILVISLVTVILRLQVERANTRLLTKFAGSLSQTIELQDCASETQRQDSVDSHRSKSFGDQPQHVGS